MDYYTALRKSGKILDAYFEQSKDILHSASKGMVRETIVSKVIRPFLPLRYGLSGGEAFDSEGNTSKQLDLVVYDAVFSYLVPYTDNYIQFPCESVYGNIEIKSKLNEEEFKKAVINIESLKSLKREDSNQLTLTPQAQTVYGSKPKKCNKYFGIIFAYNSVKVESVMSYLESLNPMPASHRPNAIVLYDKKTIIIQANDTRICAHQKDSFNRYYALNCGDDVLAIFIGLLINYTHHTLLKAADIPKETKKIMQVLLTENQKEREIPFYEFPKEK